MNEPKELNLTLCFENDDELKKGASEIVSILRPDWKRENHQFKSFNDGVTNKVIGVYTDDKTKMILIRVYGNKSEFFVDREAEIRNMKLMNKKGLGGEFYAKFVNGVAYEFIPGDVLTVESCRDPDTYPVVAATIARMHRTASEGSDKASPCLWRKLRQFNDLSPDEFLDPEKNERYKKNIISKAQRAAEIAEMEKILSGIGSPISFCHNDLLLANIIVTKSKEISPKISIKFIDFEYGDFNYQAFDIADHFCEFAGVDAVKMDYAKLYPDREFQLKWLIIYLEELKRDEGKEVAEEEVLLTYKIVNKFALTVRLLWGTWALVQAQVSKLDFDFIGYSTLIFNEYKKRKPEFLSL